MTTGATYEATPGTGWGYRVRLPNGAQLVTNDEGDGLFYINTRGEVHQDAGLSQFHAESLADFKRRMRVRIAVILGWS